MFGFNRMILLFSFTFLVNLLVQNELFAFVEQETPSYVIPEEMIIANNTNFQQKRRYEEFNQRHATLFNRVNSRLQFWRQQDQWAAKFGFEDSGFYFEEARREKTEIVRNEFFRYFRRQSRQPLRDQIDEWRRGENRDDIIDENRNITNSESVFVYDNYSYQTYVDKKEQRSEKLKSKNDKKVRLSRNYRLRFKPRLFKGILITQFDNPVANINSVIGVNEEIEVNVSRHFKKIGLYIAGNFNFGEKRTLLSVDKTLRPGFTVRLSTQEDKINNVRFEDQTLLSFNFYTKF